MTRILLTGGTGFIAAHILDQLIQEGHSVVTSVRSAAKGDNILKHHPEVGKDRLSYVIVEDIAQPDAFDSVIKSDPPFEAIIHTSSPFHMNTNDSQKDLLDPAINGTTGILRAAKASAPTVKRVIITSSFAAILDGSKGSRPGYVYSDADWNPITAEEAIQNASNGYRASKTFAERAAWDFLQKEKPSFTITTMNPPLVLGPIHDYLQNLDNLNTSNQRFAAMLAGKFKEEIPPTGVFVWVDVRDLANAHVRALTATEAQNKRFFVTAGYFNNAQLVNIVRDNFPTLQDRLPHANAMKGGGDPEEGLYKYDNAPSKDILKVSYRSLNETVVDTVNSLKKIGAWN